MPRQIDWYDTPLYYDIVFDEDSDLEADFLETLHARHGTATVRGRSVLEPACGSGRLVRLMTARGWKTAGFDASAAMLDFARERMRAEGLSAMLWQDRMESFTVPRGREFDLAHCMVSSFKYVDAEGGAVSCLERVARALKPGGIFLLGLHLTDYDDPRISHERWVDSRDGIQVVCNTRTWPADRKRRLEPIRSRLKITFPDGEVRRQETHWEARTYSAGQLRSLIRKVPRFEIVACHDFRFDPDESRGLDDSYSDIVVVLKKR